MAAQAKEAKLDRNTIAQNVSGIIGALESEALDRVQKRQTIEQRWLEDLRQYHGKYEASIAKSLEDAKRSTLFINLTRTKTNAMEARLSDMLFPTDEKNWGIGPTPVPELTIAAEQAAKKAAAASVRVAANPEDPQSIQGAAVAEQELALVKERMEEARKRARFMEEEIDDHLRECDYSAEGRRIIRDGCRIGTGVLKGPFTDGRARRSWQKPPPPKPGLDGEPAPVSNVYELKFAERERPTFKRVDPWSYFPDPNVKDVEDGEGDFERHLLNKKQLRKLARRPGFDKGAISRLIALGPKEGPPSYVADLRTITGEGSDLMKDVYQVWEYTGPITGEELVWLSYVTGGQPMLDDFGDVDPLDEVQIIAWFCQGELLKLGPHTLDSCDTLYSVFNLEEDETSPFGFGVPYIMRDPQKALAASWRSVMDNMGLSSGPQIVINEEVIEPADGQWVLTPRKVWKRKATASPDKKPFEVFNIESHLDELLAVIEVCRKNIDEETALPMLAQGDQGTQVTKTMGGMSILMNSVNVVFRRIVKHWDDRITIPSLQRIYDWLMQFSTKEHIKGDYQVDARGTSVLLVREMQSTNLMMFLQAFGTHPNLAKYLKKEGLQGLRRLAQVMMIPQDELVKTDDEIAEDDATRAKQPPVIPPEIQKMLADLNKNKDSNEARKEIALIERDTEMMKLSGQMNVSLDTVRAMLMKTDKELASKERIFAAEAALEAAQPQDDKGSGGYIA
jgi:hypothetical protein